MSTSRGILALFIALTAGCSQLSGVDDYSVGAVSAQAARHEGRCGEFLYAGQSCQECVDTSCCDAANECAKRSACRGLYDCEAGCEPSDAACRAACAGSYYGNALYSDARLDLAQCVVQNCSAACGYRGVNLFPPICAGCVEQRCDDEAFALTADRAALGYAACAAQGAYPTGIDAARTFGSACSAEGETPPTSGAATDYLNCIGECADACAEPDWSCLGNVVWPVAGSLPVDLRVAVRDERFEPIAGLRLTACGAPDPYCLGKMGEGTTGPDGVARLKFGVLDDLPYYLRSESTALFDEMLAYSVPPPQSPVAVSQFYVISRALMGDFGSPLDHAHLHVIVQSCGGRPAPGVTISLPDFKDIKPLYTNATFVPTGDDRTNSTGLAVILSVPLGIVALEARLADTEQLVARVKVPLADGRMTFVTLRPAPE
jgi:hypothetical protein